MSMAAVQFPSVSNAWTMPIKARIDMLATGIRTPVGVKVMGQVFVQGRKIKAIARELRLAGAATERRYRRAAQPLPQLGAFVPALEAMLAENGKRARRERSPTSACLRS